MRRRGPIAPERSGRRRFGSRALALALGAALSAGASGVQAQAILTPAQIGQIFCLGGLGNDMAPVEALLTADLRGTIEDAWARNAEWIAAHRADEKPPLGDGIPWRGWPDQPDECSVKSASYEMDEARVWLNYGFSGEPDAAFTDTLHLRLVAGPYGWNVWRLDNVSYGSYGGLRSALALAFVED